MDADSAIEYVSLMFKAVVKLEMVVFTFREKLLPTTVIAYSTYTLSLEVWGGDQDISLTTALPLVIMLSGLKVKFPGGDKGPVNQNQKNSTSCIATRY